MGAGISNKLDVMPSGNRKASPCEFIIPLAVGDTPASVTKGEFRLRYLPQKTCFFDSSGIATKLHVEKCLKGSLGTPTGLDVIIPFKKLLIADTSEITEAWYDSTP